MGFLGGGSGSASNTLSNVINFAPNIQTGESLSNDMTNKLDQRASSEATAKDQQSASVGVGVGGGSGSGGTNSLIDGAATLPNAKSGSAGVFGSTAAGNMPDNTTLLLGAGGLILAFILIKKMK